MTAPSCAGGAAAGDDESGRDATFRSATLTDVSSKTRNPLKLTHPRPDLCIATRHDRAMRGFGIAVIVLGGWLIGFGAGWLPGPDHEGPVDTVIVGACVAAFGVAILSWRRGVDIDLGRGEVRRWQRVLGIRLVHAVPIERVRAVRTETAISHMQNTRAKGWFVQLVLETDKRVDLLRLLDGDEAMKFAQEVADALRLRLQDPDRYAHRDDVLREVTGEPGPIDVDAADDRDLGPPELNEERTADR